MDLVIYEGKDVTAFWNEQLKIACKEMGCVNEISLHAKEIEYLSHKLKASISGRKSINDFLISSFRTLSTEHDQALTARSVQKLEKIALGALMCQSFFKPRKGDRVSNWMCTRLAQRCYVESSDYHYFPGARLRPAANQLFAMADQSPFWYEAFSHLREHFDKIHQTTEADRYLIKVATA